MSTVTLHTDIEQGTAEWLKLRAGWPTTSRFGDIVDSKWAMRKGETPKTYMAQLAGEQLMGYPLDDFTTEFADRGHMLETEALPYYELETDNGCDRIGFVTNERVCAGCSPDALVDYDYEAKRYRGAVEVKAPLAVSKSAGYIKALWGTEAEAVKAHAAQVQGQILVCELDWVDLVYYHPDLPRRIIRVYPDDEAQANLAIYVPEFAAELAVKVAKLKQLK